MQCGNRKAIFYGLVVGIGLFGLGFSTAHALVITNGCLNSGVSCTLEELSNGASFVIDDITFDNWGASDFSSIPVDLTGLDIRPLDDQPYNVGFAFQTNGGLGTSGFDLVDLSIAFELTASTGVPPIDGASFELTSFSFGAANAGGFIEGAEDVRDNLSNLLGDTFVQADNKTPVVFDLLDTTSFTPQSALSVEKMIIVGGDGIDDLVVLDEFVQRFSQANGVPAPTSPVLLITGLLALSWSRRIKQPSTRASTQPI